MNDTISQEALFKLIEGVRQKDSSAIAEIFRLYKDRVYYSALKVTKNTADAEEVVQETFIKVIKNINQLSNNQTFSSWLYKITTSTSLDLLRKRNKYLQTDDESYLDTVVDKREGPARMAFNKEVTEAIKKEISNMPDDIACVAYAKYFEEMSVDEIAENLQLSPNTVKSRLRLFRERIQPILKEQGYDPNTYYSVAIIPVLVTVFQYVIQQNAMNPNTSDSILHTVQSSVVAVGAVGTGILAAFKSKAVVGALVASGVIASGAGVYYLGNRANNYVASIEYNENYTNTLIPVSVTFKNEFTNGEVPKVYYDNQALESSFENGVLTFEAGENGEYRIKVGNTSKDFTISNLDEVGPYVDNISYHDGILSFNASDNASGINTSASYIENGDQIIYFDEIYDYNEIYVELNSLSYMYIYDNAGNVTKCTLHNN